MKLNQATEGFIFSLKAEGYSPSTIDLYRYVLGNLENFLQNPEVEAIKPADLTRYFAYLRDGYKPDRKSGDISPLSGGTLQNHWKGIRCFFRWAVDELRLKKRPDEKLKLPSKNPRAILPLSEDEVKALVKAAEFTQEAKPRNRKAFRMRRRTADRDTAIIFSLLDTGLRVGELGRLSIKDVNLQTGEVYVAPYGNNNRKTKSRTVYFGKNTLRVIWRYLSTRKDSKPEDPLFLSSHGVAMDRNSIRLLLAAIGEKAEVKNVHPHRMRHTFAIEFLRNGGDVFSLQRLLGHTSLEMVRNYLELAQADTQNAHRRASPADKWRLN